MLIVVVVDSVKYFLFYQVFDITRFWGVFEEKNKLDTK